MRHGRLRRRDFEEVFKKGSKGAVGNVVVYVLPNKMPVCRLGFAVSRKVGSTVKRNRVRRLLREVCRLNEDCFKPGYDYVILGRGSAGEAGYGSMESAVKEAVRRLKENSIEDTRFSGA
ncbi:MAG: ribonuclease P protein component [Bacillota bacterium]